jgi:hypothetical protein
MPTVTSATASVSQRIRYRAAGRSTAKNAGMRDATFVLCPVKRIRARERATESRSPCAVDPAAAWMADSSAAPAWYRSTSSSASGPVSRRRPARRASRSHASRWAAV